MFELKMLRYVNGKNQEAYIIPCNIIFTQGKLKGITGTLVGFEHPNKNSQCYTFRIEINDGEILETPYCFFTEIEGEK
jgi:hypothetical protein